MANATKEERNRARLERIAEWLRAECEEHTHEDPYRLVYTHSRAFDDVEALDRLVMKCANIAPSDPRRIAFLMWCRVDAATNAGHTCIAARDVVAYVQARTGVARPDVLQVFAAVIGEGAITSHTRADSTRWLSLAPIARAESNVAEFLARPRDASLFSEADSGEGL